MKPSPAQFVKNIKNYFFPAKPRWREKSLADGRLALKGILKANSLLGE
ncbi:MAG: hypothetical protein WBL25_08220 [Anaerolineales bacterium]